MGQGVLELLDLCLFQIKVFQLEIEDVGDVSKHGG
jgi:hypothetical protein